MIRFHRAGWWDHSHSFYSSLYFLTGLKYSWWKKRQDQRSVAEGKVIALFRIPPEWPHFLDDDCQLFMSLTNHFTSHLRHLLSSCLRRGRHKDTQTQPLPSGGSPWSKGMKRETRVNDLCSFKASLGDRWAHVLGIWCPMTRLEKKSRKHHQGLSRHQRQYWENFPFSWICGGDDLSVLV